MEDLEEAITCHRQALALLPHGHHNRSMALNNLANAVSTRFQQFGRIEDLEEAITCHRQALTLRPHGHPGRSFSLNNLAKMPCPLALSNQGTTMICWMQSSISLKPRIYYQLGIHTNQQLSSLSLPSFSSNVILPRKPSGASHDD